MKILLQNFQSPGDILMLTACVRDLKKAHPQINVNCNTSAQELWQNNPNLDLTVNRQTADKIIKMQYPLIHTSNKGAHHFIHGFHQFLQQKLNIRIPVTALKADVYLSEFEKQLNLIGDDKPYWIIDAGYKNDFTCKMWQYQRFQEVIDRTKDKIRWVQIGASEHNHKPLKNVINMVGKTNHRQLISLMYRASGVLTPVSYPMHLSTMQWKDHPNRNRPCVVIAGAREPSVWQQYTCHQFIHNCGALPCSFSGGCWKSRVEKLGDLSDKNNSLCEYPVKTSSGQVIPKCMDMITVDQVIRRIYLYLEN